MCKNLFLCFFVIVGQGRVCVASQNAAILIQTEAISFENLVKMENSLVSLSAGLPNLRLELADNALSELLLKHRSALELYDRFNKAKYTYFMNRALWQLACIGKLYESKAPKELKRVQTDVNIALEKYVQKRGDSRVTAEIDATIQYRLVFLKLIEFGHFIRNEGQGWKDRLRALLKTSEVYWRVGLKVPRILKALFFELESPPGRTPIIESLKGGFREYGDLRGYEIRWTGFDDSDLVLDGETVDLFVFEHAQSVLDTVAQANLPEMPIGFVGAADVIYPKFVADRLHRSEEYVVVGRGNEVQKVVELIRKKKLAGFFIAAEGFTPYGFYETRPLRSEFLNALEEMHKMGMKIRIRPISFPSNFRILNELDNSMEWSRMIHAHHSMILEADQLKKMISLKGGWKNIETFIRISWISSYSPQHDGVMGMPGVKEIQSKLDTLLWNDDTVEFNDSEKLFDCAVKTVR